MKKSKILKRLVVFMLIMGITMTGGISFSKAADNSGTFNFNLRYGTSDYSDAVTKNNGNDVATGRVTSGHLSTSDYMRFQVWNSAKTVQYGTETKATSTNNPAFMIQYGNNIPSMGINLRLKGISGYYQVSAEGTWTP